MTIVEHLVANSALATVSGVVTTTPQMIAWVDANLPAIGLITTKSVQLRPNPGYREPVILEWQPGDFGNAVGLRNPGVDEFVAELAALRERTALRSPIAVSIAGDGPESVAALGLAVAPVADLIEVNLSCPHASGDYGQQLGSDPAIAGRVIATLAAALHDRLDDAPPVLAKLSPNVDKLAAIATACIEAGAAGLTAINTVGPRTYHHSVADASVLQNPRGGLGGMSGSWIHERALTAVAEIRAAVGSKPMIVGMGGVSTPQQVAAMRSAGADVVGVGSAFGRVAQGSWRRWTAGLATGLGTAEASDAATAQHSSQSSLRPAAGMAYTPLTVAAVRRLGGDLVELEFDAAYRSEAGQFVFLWLPGCGEKPFSLAWTDPATVLVRERGPVTRALAALVAGDRVFVRGPYGANWQPPQYRRWLLLAGGCGAAVVPLAAARLSNSDRTAQIQTEVWIGTRDRSATILESVFARLPEVAVRQTADDSRGGRFVAEAFDAIAADATEPVDRSTKTVGMLFIGPEALHDRIAATIDRSAPWVDLHIAVERTCLCGVGICGLCSVEGKLTCQRGTIFRYKDVPHV